MPFPLVELTINLIDLFVELEDWWWISLWGLLVVRLVCLVIRNSNKFHQHHHNMNHHSHIHYLPLNYHLQTIGQSSHPKFTMLEKYQLREARRDKERSLEDQQIYSRKFDLHQYFSPASRNTKRFIYYDKSTGISHVHDANEMAGDPKSLVVAVDGTCAQEGSGSESKSSYGIFFGEDSSFNMYDTIETSDRKQHTNDYAHLMGIDRALNLIKNSPVLEKWRSTGEREGAFTTIIMTDSAYVYDNFTTSIWLWRKNGFESSEGKQVVYGELIDKIDKAILDLAEDKILVRFWSVPREDNKEAEKLANRALEGEM